MSLRSKGLLLLTVTLVLELSLVGAQMWMVQDAQNEVQEERHARAVIERLDRLSNLRQSMTIGIEELVCHPESTKIDKQFDRYVGEVVPALEALKWEVRGESGSAQVEQIEHSHLQALSLLKHHKENFRAGLLVQNLPAIYKLFKLSEESTQQSDALSFSYKRLAEQFAKMQAASREKSKNLLLVGVGLNVALVCILAMVFLRGITRRLVVVRDNSMRLATGQELRPPLKGSDEIADVDRVFHQMAAELSEAARKERAVIENAVDVICSIDADQRIASINPAASSWGYTPEELLGMRLSMLLVPEDRDKTLKILNEIEKEGSTRTFENRLIHKDKRPIDLSWSAHWSEVDRRVFCVAHDITGRKEIDRLKQEFVSMVSHDLKTPLTSIKGTLSLISAGLYGTVSDKGHDRIFEAERSIERLMSLVRGLVDIEKMESGKLTVNLQPVDLSMVIDRSLAEVKGFAEQQSVTVESDCQNMDVLGDEDRLVQVMVNLLSNAIKFSPHAGTVVVSALPQSNSIEVRVRDAGRGIPEEFRTSLFQRFKQVDVSDGKKLGGTGLGLAICKAIIDAHQGEIGADNNGDTPGSTFWFRIPMVEPNGSNGSDSPA